MENVFNQKEAKKKLTKYLFSSKGILRVMCLIFAAATLFSLVQCTVLRRTDDKENAPAFDPISTPSDQFCYIDVVGVSDWVYKVTNNNSSTIYYTAMDDNGYFYVLTIKAGDYAKLTEQNDWWNADDDSPAPEPCRLYGIGYSMNSDVKEAFSEYYEMNSSEVERTFGDKVFSAGTSSAAGTNGMWTFFTVFGGIMWFAAACISAVIKKATKRSLKAIAERGELELAASELDSENALTITSGKKKLAVLADNYVFGRNTGEALRYEDILWAYMRSVYSYGVVNNSIVINTAKRKNLILCGLGGGNVSSSANAVFAALQQHNPDVLLGMTRENKKRYKELVKQKKQENR